MMVYVGGMLGWWREGGQGVTRFGRWYRRRGFMLAQEAESLVWSCSRLPVGATEEGVTAAERSSCWLLTFGVRVAGAAACFGALAAPSARCSVRCSR